MRRTLTVSLVVLLLALSGVEQYRPLLRYSGPDSKLRGEINRGWSAQLPVPDPFIEVIGKHVERMYARGYFRDFNYTDFWHGHLMLRAGAPQEFASVSELMDANALFIYHTAEFAERWKREAPKPLWQRTPRSIVGFWDGRVTPAVTLVKPGISMPFYTSNGTISDSELRDSHPDWFNATFEPSIVRLGPKAWCAASRQFHLVLDPWGRLTVGGMRYDVYIRCEIDPRELGLEGYQSRRREYVTDTHPW